MPTVPSTQFRPDLAQTLMEFDLQADQMGLVGLRIAPAIEVDKPGGEYGKIELKELLKSRDTNRANDGSYQSGQGKGTKDTYSCDEHGLEERVDRREAAMFREYWDSEQLAALRCRDAVIRNHSKRVVDLALGIGTTTAAGTVWSTTATATPIANVRAAAIAIRNRTGMVPNAICMDWEAWTNLKDCAEIVDRIKYWGGQDPNRGRMTPAAVAQALDLDEVIISGAMQNNAVEPTAASLASQWDRTQALVFVKAPMGRERDLRSPRLAATFHWGEDGSQIGGVVESYYDPRRRGDIIRSRMDTDEKLVYAACGQRITGVLA